MTRPIRPKYSAVAITRVQGTPPMLLVALFLLIGTALIAGCGASTTENAAPASAHATHEAWVTALRNGDEEAATGLADPSLPDPAAFARDAVTRMQDYITSSASPTGPLQDVTIEPVVDGVGRSVWQFSAKRWCYRAELVSRGDNWFVSRWGQTSVDCS
jgi:hypothetical protein